MAFISDSYRRLGFGQLFLHPKEKPQHGGNHTNALATKYKYREKRN